MLRLRAMVDVVNPVRETFASRIGLVLSMMGVAVGLGNVWRFPYMVGEFGGAPFVLFYAAVVVFLGIPALMAEWALGRHTRRGPVGAFERAGFPGGKIVGWFFFAVVAGSSAYYTSAIGWVVFHGVGQLGVGLGVQAMPDSVLPPPSGFNGASLAQQAVVNAIVLASGAAIVSRGLRAGIERASRVLMPLLFFTLLLLVARSLTLPGSWEGVRWYALKFDPAALTGKVMFAALGQAFFSLSLGGTFMVVYGSYLGRSDGLGANATWTAAGDAGVGLLAGLAIIPAVFAFGLEPSSGPGLIFETLPQVFERIPVGWAFGALFFLGLAGAAFLSNVANMEVMVAALTDEAGKGRPRAAWGMALVVFVTGLIPALNMEIFSTWDLTFGSGMQTLGGALAVVAFAWSMDRARAMEELTRAESGRQYAWLYYWLRWFVPGAIGSVGIYWLLTDVLGVVGGV